MTAVLMPKVYSYFAIYTLMNPGISARNRSSSWDLHATATDRSLAMAHARILALQPGVDEVQVKRVDENLASGLVSVRNIRCWKKGAFNPVRLVVYALAFCAVAGLIKFIF